MNEYSTLEQFREYLTASSIDMERWDDNKMLQYIEQASRRIDKWCDRRFYPRMAARYFNYQSAYDLLVDDDLLAVSDLSAGGTPITNTDYILYPLNTYPKWKIEIDKSKNSILTYISTHQKAVTVTGTWGWHNDWDNAWNDSQDTVQDSSGITATATTVTVSDTDGADINGFTPRFSPGQLLKIESEYVQVIGVSSAANSLTVRRGMNGTTAATHAKDKAISIYRPPEIILRACLEVAKLFYEMRSATGGVIAMPQLDGSVMRVSTTALLKDLGLPVRGPNVMGFV